MGLLPTKSLGNVAASANKSLPVFVINPTGEGRSLRPLCARRVMMLLMFALCGLCAAVFTEPPITQIEEVGRLVHKPGVNI